MENADLDLNYPGVDAGAADTSEKAVGGGEGECGAGCAGSESAASTSTTSTVHGQQGDLLCYPGSHVRHSAGPLTAGTR